MRLVIYFLSLLLILSACQNNNRMPVKKDSKERSEISDEESVDRSKVSNEIKIKATGGVKVKRAYLTLADGTVLHGDNLVDVGEKAVLHLNVDGWEVEDGRSLLGASERITTNTGREVLDAADLFKGYSENGIDADDAKLLVLSAVITKMEVNYDHFIVAFRVWDKKGEGEITGSYKLYVR